MQKHEVRGVFDTIFGVGAASELDINSDDEKYAKLLLSELIDTSCKMSVVEGIFRTSVSFNPSLVGLIKNIVVSAAKNCNGAVNEGKYYTSVRDTIRRNWKSAFEIRKQTGEW